VERSGRKRGVDALHVFSSASCRDVVGIIARRAGQNPPANRTDPPAVDRSMRPFPEAKSGGLQLDWFRVPPKRGSVIGRGIHSREQGPERHDAATPTRELSPDTPLKAVFGVGGGARVRERSRGGDIPESELFERGLEVRREVLGADYVDADLGGADEFMIGFQRAVTELAWGYAWSRPGLDRKTVACSAWRS